MMMMPCCCGCAPAPEPVKRFTNVTQVTGGIAPYMRPQNDCSVGVCITPACGGVGQPVCYDHNFDGTPYDWVAGIKGIADCTGGALVSLIADNCYSHDGSTMYSIDTHCGQGWKGVAASKNWQGMFGFINSGSPCCYTGGTVTNKYRVQNVLEEGSFAYRNDNTLRCDGSPDDFVETTYEHNLQQTSTVDDYGNVSRSGGIRMKFKQTQTSGTNSYLSSCLFDDCTGESAGLTGAWTYPNLSPFIPRADFPLSAQCGIISVGYPLGDPNHGLFPSVQDTAANLNAASYMSPPTTTTYVDGSGRTHTLSVASSQPAVFELTDTTLKVSWEFTATDTAPRLSCGGHPTSFTQVETVSIRYSKTITLDGAEAYSSVITSANNLLAEWKLDDDLQYPWRTDGACWLLPFVSLDEGQGQPSIEWGQDDCGADSRSVIMDVLAVCTGCHYVSTNNYTGQIRGSPLPNGYGFHFNYFHKVFEVCCSSGIPGVCTKGLGELGATPLPPTATQWTNYSDGWAMRGPGGHVSQYDGFRGAPLGSVVVQKWAETLNAWPRENLARPASRDRYLFEETDVACGSLAWPNITLTSAPITPFGVGDKVAIGTEVYAITGGSGLAYTVGSKLYGTPISCDGVSKVRYPTARAIMSTLAATAVQTSPGLVTVTTTEKHRLKAGGSEQDTVTFTGIGGLTTAAATVTSDTVFTVSGTLTTSPSTGTISDGGSALDSTCSTHTFLYRTFKSQYREHYDDSSIAPVAVTEALLSISPSSRHPTVLCISPNGESFPSGVTYGFGTIGADMCHGADWSATFVQAVPSVFWQAPHHPCGVGGSWTQVALPCDTPGAGEYDFPPLVEPNFEGTPDADGLYYAGYAYPGAVGRDTCVTLPHGNSHPPQWYPAWKTCDYWKEIIGFKC